MFNPITTSQAGISLLQNAVQIARARHAPEPTKHMLEVTQLVFGKSPELYGVYADFQSGKFDVFKNSIPATDTILNKATTGIGQIVDILAELQNLAIEVDSVGELSDSQKETVNRITDLAFSRIGQIVNSTTYSGRNLIGDYSEDNVKDVSSGIADLNVTSVDITGSSKTIAISVQSPASAAEIEAAFGDQDSASTIRISGVEGVATVEIPAGAMAKEVVARINIAAAQTGVIAELEGATAKFVSTSGVGTESFAKFELLEGNFTDSAGNTLADQTAYGADAIAFVNGQQVVSAGNTLYIDTGGVQANLRIDDSVTGSTSLRFTVFGNSASNTNGPDPIANNKALADLIEELDASPEALGLGDLKQGELAELASNPRAAVEIIGVALDKLSEHIDAIDRFMQGEGYVSPETASFQRLATAGLTSLNGEAPSYTYGSAESTAFLMNNAMSLGIYHDMLPGPLSKMFQFFF
ncbi:MAG: hypothetical protein NUW37_15235 [Planctomycetes bacterium]|nr:hypothetical protein [Planctomycetota bacterium]